MIFKGKIKLLFAFVAIFGSAGYVAYLMGPGYERELRTIRENLAQMNNVRSFSVHGIQDFGLDHFAAHVELIGGGTIEFREITPQSFEDATKIFVESFGEYRVRVVHEALRALGDEENSSRNSRTYGMITDIGASSPAANLLGITVKSVQDVVLNYDAICSALASWPVFPNTGMIRDKDGVTHYYWVEPIEDGNK